MIKTKQKKSVPRPLEELLLDRASYDYECFCARNSISVSYLHRLIARGLGPKVTYVLGKNLITAESERDWKERMSNPTGAAAAAAKREKAARSAKGLNARMARADMEGAR